jgi:uncharacterized protein
VRRVITRNAVVLSRQGGILPRMLLPYRLFMGGPLGGGRQWFPWVHLTDAVRAIRFLVEHEEAQGVYNLAAPGVLTNAEWARVIGQILKRPAWLPAPTLALRLLLGESSTLVLDGQRALPKRLLEAGFTFQFPQAEAALRDLLEPGTAVEREMR